MNRTPGDGRRTPGDPIGPDARPRSRTVTVTGADGVRLAVRLTGPAEPAAPPVLCVHGLASNARLFDGVATRLAAAGHPVAAYDQRGHGRSDAPDLDAGRYRDAGVFVEDLLAVLDGLGWDRAVLCGQSWGGNVVVRAAATRPGRTIGAVLVDGGVIDLPGAFGSWEDCAARLAPPVLGPVPVDELARMLRERHPDWPEEGITGTLANFRVDPDGRARPALARDAHMAILRSMWDDPPGRWLARLRRPAVAVLARRRGAGTWERARERTVRAAVAAGAPLEVLWWDGDHDLHAQHPGRLAHLIATRAAGWAADAAEGTRSDTDPTGTPDRAPEPPTGTGRLHHPSGGAPGHEGDR